MHLFVQVLIGVMLVLLGVGVSLLVLVCWALAGSGGKWAHGSDSYYRVK